MSQIPRLHPGTKTDASAPSAAVGAPRPDPWADENDDWPAERAHPEDVHDQSPLRSLGEAVSDVVRSTAAGHPMEQVLKQASQADTSGQPGHHTGAEPSPRPAKPRP